MFYSNNYLINYFFSKIIEVNQIIIFLEVFMAAKFDVYKDSNGQFRFRLKAANGEIIATSEAYTAKSGCMNGIESVKNNAPQAEIIEIDS